MTQLVIIAAWTVLATLATARITRLITTDKISEPARRAAINLLGAKSMLVYLLHCPWCMSIWVAPALAAAIWWPLDLATKLDLTSWLGYPILALAIAHAAALTLAKEN